MKQRSKVKYVVTGCDDTITTGDLLVALAFITVTSPIIVKPINLS